MVELSATGEMAFNAVPKMKSGRMGVHYQKDQPLKYIFPNPELGFQFDWTLSGEPKFTVGPMLSLCLQLEIQKTLALTVGLTLTPAFSLSVQEEWSLVTKRVLTDWLPDFKDYKKECTRTFSADLQLSVEVEVELSDFLKKVTKKDTLLGPFTLWQKNTPLKLKRRSMSCPSSTGRAINGTDGTGEDTCRTDTTCVPCSMLGAAFSGVSILASGGTIEVSVIVSKLQDGQAWMDVTQMVTVVEDYGGNATQQEDATQLTIQSAVYKVDCTVVPNQLKHDPDFTDFNQALNETDADASISASDAQAVEQRFDIYLLGVLARAVRSSPSLVLTIGGTNVTLTATGSEGSDLEGNSALMVPATVSELFNASLYQSTTVASSSAIAHRSEGHWPLALLCSVMVLLVGPAGSFKC